MRWVWWSLMTIMAQSFGGRRETTSEVAETPNDPEEEPQYLLLTSAASSGTPTSTVAGVEVSMHDHDPVPSTSNCVRRSDRAQQTPRARYIESSSDEEEEINATIQYFNRPLSPTGVAAGRILSKKQLRSISMAVQSWCSFSAKEKRSQNFGISGLN